MGGLGSGAVTSRLIVGTPRIPAKPPRRSPCNHPRFEDSDILPNGGFELGFNQGPLGNEVPGFANVGGLDRFPWFNWNDGTEAPIPAGLWWQDLSTSSERWFYSTASPRSGTHHLRQNLSGFGPGELRPTTFYVCPNRSVEYRSNGGTAFSFWQVGASAVVEEGDIWTMGWWSKAGSIVKPLQWTLQYDLHNADDSDGLFGSGAVFSQALTTAYAHFEYSAVIPSAGTLGFTPHLLFIRIRAAWTGATGSTTVDVDDATLGIV